MSGHEVKDVVITCPAYFNEAERMATKAAGELAKLNVLAVVDEPIAAAISYGMGIAETIREKHWRQGRSSSMTWAAVRST